MSVHVRSILPWVSLACFAAAIVHVAVRREHGKLAAPPITPLVSPFRESIAASGIVEARSENVNVAPAVSGVVHKVDVVVGEHVEQGQPLFCLDDRQLRADLRIRQAEFELAESELAVLNNQPREEEVAIAQARVRNAEALLSDAEDEAERLSKMSGDRAVSHRDVVHAERLLEVARAVLDERRAELQLLNAGACEHEKQVKQRQVQCAAARCRQVETEMERLVTRSPIAGEVLQVNICPGEFISLPLTVPPIVLGDTAALHVRTDIDEIEIPRFHPHSSAVAAARGSSQDTIDLSFVRIEPHVVPKKWVSGFQHQIVDTRVLQIIYRVGGEGASRLFVGQQVDVFIDADRTDARPPRQEDRLISLPEIAPSDS